LGRRNIGVASDSPLVVHHGEHQLAFEQLGKGLPLLRHDPGLCPGLDHGHHEPSIDNCGHDVHACPSRLRFEHAPNVAGHRQFNGVRRYRPQHRHRFSVWQQLALEKCGVPRDNLLCPRNGSKRREQPVRNVHRGYILCGRRGRDMPSVPSWLLRLDVRLIGVYVHSRVPSGLIFKRRGFSHALHAVPCGLLLRGWRNGAGGVPRGAVLHCEPSHRLLSYSLHGGHVLPGRPLANRLPCGLFVRCRLLRAHCLRGGVMPRGKQRLGYGEPVLGRLVLPLPNHGKHGTASLPRGCILPRRCKRAHGMPRGHLRPVDGPSNERVLCHLPAGLLLPPWLGGPRALPRG